MKKQKKRVSPSHWTETMRFRRQVRAILAKKAEPSDTDMDLESVFPLVVREVVNALYSNDPARIRTGINIFGSLYIFLETSGRRRFVTGRVANMVDILWVALDRVSATG